MVMDNATNRFNTVINAIRTAPRLAPPLGLADRIMTHISSAGIHVQHHRDWPPNRTTSAPYFFMTALFFLILGVTLFIGLEQGPVWLRMQPLFALLCSALFGVLGLLLKTDSPLAPRIIRLGITYYSILILGNTLAISPMTTSGTIGILLTVALFAACLFMGQILARSVFTLDLSDTTDKATS